MIACYLRNCWDHFAYVKKFIINKVMEGKGRTDVIDADSAASALSANGGITKTQKFMCLSFQRTTNHLEELIQLKLGA